ncbi:MAG TPA: hypothetical protein VKA31_06295 [Mariprofundaceae bacterium]|nr:hypothetical protein [Mariprofundaceae bacterium]
MKLTIAFFQEGEHWIAQCKELDIAACPDRVWQKCVERAEAIRAEIEGTETE